MNPYVIGMITFVVSRFKLDEGYDTEAVLVHFVRPMKDNIWEELDSTFVVDEETCPS